MTGVSPSSWRPLRSLREEFFGSPMRFRWEILLVLSLTGATVWLAMGGRVPAWFGFEQEMAVGVVKVKKRATAVTVNVSGAIMPVREVMVVSRLAGRITELRVNQGDVVRAGEVIATVHSTA